MDAKQAGMAATGAAEVGAGAGASAAEAPLTAESATNTTSIFGGKAHPTILQHLDMDKLQWGKRKRMRCVKVKDSPLSGKSDSGGGGAVVKKKITSRVVDNNCSKDGSVLPSPHRSTRDLGVSRSIANDTRKALASLSPEKEDRYYTTRGSGGFDDATKALFVDPKEENRKVVWPKLLIALSSKEKEEDFMAMKGCKPPQRPKKRAKLIQRTILVIGEPGSVVNRLVPGEKPRGLKGMGTVESDSE
ncbi:hypothetical protein SASPL_124524 [Salvia splendens]|uniref:Uncharacterized protein n=1 Tax=Salvia splendens TaxID=180675 RepID=A0A8X8XI74_SALSN|nr:hypothetical protein SASPL_124524 [Salvia splendens]